MSERDIKTATRMFEAIAYSFTSDGNPDAAGNPGSVADALFEIAAALRGIRSEMALERARRNGGIIDD